MGLRRLARLVTVLAAGGTMVYCGDGTGPEESVLERLVGTWAATEIVITSELDPTLTIDVVDEGVGWEMTVTDDSLAIIDVSNPIGTERIGGRLRIEGDSLFLASLESSEVVLAMQFTLTGDDVLRLMQSGFEQCGSYGWEADECPIPTTIRITAQRAPSSHPIVPGRASPITRRVAPAAAAHPRNLPDVG